jgi:thiol-disulfide isomerase/thioredoxin
VGGGAGPASGTTGIAAPGGGRSGSRLPQAASSSRAVPARMILTFIAAPIAEATAAGHPKSAALVRCGVTTYGRAMRAALILPLLLPLLLLACNRASEQAKAPKAPDQPAWSGPRAAEAVPAGRLDRSHAGAPAPAAAFEDPRGGKASLSDFRGRPLLVNLWATWCAPCVTELPTIDALAAREDGRLRILAISQDNDGRAKVDRFFADHHFSALEPYIDSKLGLMPELGADTLPTTILYDSDGREVWRMIGIADWGSRSSAALIAEAFK